jgi:hypothetical protein
VIAAAAAVTGFVTFKKTAGDVAVVCVAVAYLLIGLASGGTKRANVSTGVDDDKRAAVTHDERCRGA